MQSLTLETKSPLSPLCLLEEVFHDYDWNYERDSEHEISAEIEGRWCNYRLFAMWRQDLGSLMLSSLIDVKIPSEKLSPVTILLAAFNPRLWLGHFEITPDYQIPAFRYNLVLKGNTSATLEQIEDIVTAAITECDRLYPALQFVLWGGKTPEEAMMAAMLDTHGEA
jgi:hypothetical protein